MNFYDLVNTEIVEPFLYCLVYIGSRMGSYINLLIPAIFLCSLAKCAWKKTCVITQIQSFWDLTAKAWVYT